MTVLPNNFLTMDKSSISSTSTSSGMTNQSLASSNQSNQKITPLFTNNELNTQSSKSNENKELSSTQSIPFRHQTPRATEQPQLNISQLLPPPSSSLLANYEHILWNDTNVTYSNNLPPLHSFSYPPPSYAKVPQFTNEYMEVGPYTPPWMSNLIKEHNIQFAEQRVSQLKQKVIKKEDKLDKLITTQPNFVTPATLTYVSNNLSLYLNGPDPEDDFWKSRLKQQPPFGLPEIRKFEKDPHDLFPRQQ